MSGIHPAIVILVVILLFLVIPIAIGHWLSG